MGGNRPKHGTGLNRNRWDDWYGGEEVETWRCVLEEDARQEAVSCMKKSNAYRIESSADPEDCTCVSAAMARPRGGHRAALGLEATIE